MKTKYEIVIDSIAYAMGDHSYNICWYFDFDEQDTVPLIEETGCYPEKGHRLLRIEPIESWESFPRQVMVGFASASSFLRFQ